MRIEYRGTAAGERGSQGPAHHRRGIGTSELDASGPGTTKLERAVETGTGGTVAPGNDVDNPPYNSCRRSSWPPIAPTAFRITSGWFETTV